MELSKVVAVLAVTLGLGGMANAASKADVEDAAIRQLFKSLDQGWTKGDPAAASEAFTPKGKFVTPYGDVAIGRDQLKALYTKILTDTPMKGSHHTSTIHDIRMATPNTAVVDYDVTVEGVTVPNGPPATLKFNAAGVLVKTGKKWLMSDCFAWAPPAPPPSPPKAADRTPAK